MRVTVIVYVYVEIHAVFDNVVFVFIRLESEFIIGNFGRFAVNEESEVERFVIRILARIVPSVFAYVVKHAFDVEQVLSVV